MTLVSAERFSGIIGRIYDCAIEPLRWPATMEAICKEFGFVSSVIFTLDLHSSEQSYVAEWNTSRHYQEVLARALSGQVMEIYERSLSQRMSIDEPMVLSRIVDREAFRRSPMYLEWAKPQGYGDGLNVTVLDPPPKLGTLAVAKREIDGDFSDDEIGIMRLLAPHIRRAVTIGGLIDMKTIAAERLSATLDSLSVGIVLINAEAEIVHANGAAREMFRNGAPIRQRHGHLAATESAGTSLLLEAIRLAVSNEAGIGAAGIGIPLAARNDVPAAAHVLPLGRGSLRPHLMPSALAAVFVTPPESPIQLGVHAAARTYGLTEAETRFLARLAAGQTVIEAAEKLRISESTARTHLAHIFSKCGVSRQAELTRLVLSLAAPVKSA